MSDIFFNRIGHASEYRLLVCAVEFGKLEGITINLDFVEHALFPQLVPVEPTLTIKKLDLVMKNTELSLRQRG